jgi:uncharacterized membrane protein YccC
VSKSYLAIAGVIVVAGLSFLAWRGASSGDWSSFVGTLVGLVVGSVVVALLGPRLARRRRHRAPDEAIRNGGKPND